jgi:hypothetical protein
MVSSTGCIFQTNQIFIVDCKVINVNSENKKQRTDDVTFPDYQVCLKPLIDKL